jgi:tetratricopeptide (TPR) repeat protein
MILTSKKHSIMSLLMLTLIGLARPAISAAENGVSGVNNTPWKIQAIALTRPIEIGTLQILFNEAESLYQSKRYSQASDAFVQLLELEPRLTGVWFRLANSWQQQGNMDWATQAYLEAIRKDSVQLPSQPSDVAAKALKNLINFHLNAAQDAVDKAESDLMLSEIEQQEMSAKVAKLKVSSDQLVKKMTSASLHRSTNTLTSKRNNRLLPTSTKASSKVDMILGLAK